MFLYEKTLNIKNQLIPLGAPKIMGILNLTPDSFFDGGKYTHDKPMLKQTEKLLQEGATFIDVGGFSSRPGARNVPLQEELNRVIPAIRAIMKSFPGALLSIDTFRSTVAQQALDEGAVMINDISGGQLDKDMFNLAVRYRAPYILTHMRGTIETMHHQTTYAAMLVEMTQFFRKKIKKLHQKGARDIMIDPGFGFSKTTKQNFEILKHLSCLHVFDKPLVVGISRKSLIWKTLKTDPEKALTGSIVLNALLLLKGAHILRVHDVKEAVEVMKLISFVT